MENTTKNGLDSSKYGYNKLKSLFEKINLGFIYHDYDGKVVEVNSAASRILGFSLKEIQEKSYVDHNWKCIHENGSYFSPETHPNIIALKTGEPVLNKIMGIFNPKLKNYKWVKVNAVPEFKNGAQKPFQVFTTFDDITSHKKKEFLIKEYKSQFLKVIHNSANAILFTRFIDDKIVEINNKASKIMNTPIGELKKIKLSDLNLWGSQENYSSFKQQLKKNEKVKDFECRFILKDGNTKTIFISAELVNIDAEKFILVIVKDTVKIKKTEAVSKKHSDFTNIMTENHPAGIVACNAEGKLVLFNKTAKKWHGVDVMKIPQEQWAEHYGLYKGDQKTLLKHD